MNKSIQKIAVEGILISTSIVIGIIDHQLGTIGIKFLNLMYLLPLFLIEDMFGTKSGILCLFSANMIKSIFFSKSGILGFLLRLSAIVYMLFRKRGNSWKKCFIFDLIGILLTMLIQYPASYIFYKSLIKFDNIKFIMYNIFMDSLSFLIVVIISRVINLKHIKGNYDEIIKRDCD